MKNIEVLKEEDIKDITLGYIEVVFMPNGEVISHGKSLGFLSAFKKEFGDLRIYVEK